MEAHLSAEPPCLWASWSLRAKPSLLGPHRNLKRWLELIIAPGRVCSGTSLAEIQGLVSVLSRVKFIKHPTVWRKCLTNYFRFSGAKFGHHQCFQSSPEKSRGCRHGRKPHTNFVNPEYYYNYPGSGEKTPSLGPTPPWRFWLPDLEWCKSLLVILSATGVQTCWPSGKGPGRADLGKD